MAKEKKSEALQRITSDYLDAIVELYRDSDAKLAKAVDEALDGIKQEKFFKSNISNHLDPVSIIAIASILGF